MICLCFKLCKIVEDHSHHRFKLNENCALNSSKYEVLNLIIYLIYLMYFIKISLPADGKS